MTGRGGGRGDHRGAGLPPAGGRGTGAHGGRGDHPPPRPQRGPDLDTLEEQAQDYVGTFKIQVAGPWTLAATVERPRGDKVLADHGARRELAQALGEGLRDHVADVRRRLPGVDRLVVQLDEPALPAVLSAAVPTASGFGRHRNVDLPVASEALEWVLAAIEAAGAEPWVHSCAPGVPWSVLHQAGARGLSADVATLSAADHDALAEAIEGGTAVALGVLPGTDPATVPTDAQVTESVLRWLDMLGLDPVEVGERLVVSPACGLAGASRDWARTALTLLTRTAGNLSG
jgi:methionine synthase II (cobalamin-independent)